jgi:hypothetical protein
VIVVHAVSAVAARATRVASGASGDKGPNHVPGVVITGVIIGVLLLLAAIRAMFGKRKP